MRRYLAIPTVVALVVLTVASGALLYRARQPIAVAAPTEPIADKVERMDSIYIRGAVDAPVTVEEFADFECEPCGMLAGIIKQVQADAGPSLRVVFRHYPLAMHSHSQQAALAAEAAGMQGRFWEMHDLLFSEQSSWSGAADVQSIFQGYAQRLELDLDRFIKDSVSPAAAARIAADRERATLRGVNQTPTLFINDWVVPRFSYSVEGLRSRVGMMEATVSLKPPESAATARPCNNYPSA